MRRRITRRSRFLILCLRLPPRLVLRLLGLAVRRDRVATVVAVVVVDDVVVVVVAAGVTGAKRRERRMWLLLASLVGWGFLALEDMSVDGEDMAGEVAVRVGVEVVAAEVEVRRRLFRLVDEGFLHEIESPKAP